MPENTPVYCFTIPSVSDGTLLDCRIYHPVSLQDAQLTKQRTRKAALIAHPYAPLGGSMDDAVVTTIIDELLGLDFVVGSFNFRGAASSHGSTSWSGKAERDDYISVAGHLIFYMSQLQTSQTVAHDIDPPEPISGHVQRIPSKSITMLLGGYSYGSLIVTHLPPIAEILAIFHKPSKWISEILLRAKELALQTEISLSESRGRLPHVPSRKQHERQSSSRHSIIYGGNDSPSPADRHIDPIHKAIEVPTRIKHAIHRTHKSTPSTSTLSSNTSENLTAPMPALPHISPHYLLISPLLPPLSNFLSLSTSSLFFWRHHSDHQPQNLLQHPTLVIYGTKDMFTSSTKLDTWCKKTDTMAIQKKGSFRWRKVEGAGHFWRERGVEVELRLSVREWVDEVVV